MKISFFPSRSITIKTPLSEAQAFVRQEAGQTFVTVKMQLGGCIIAFAVVWCYTPFLMLFLNISSWLGGKGFSPTIFYVSLGALGFMWVLMNGGFRDGETAAKAFLIKTFDGELV